MVRTISKVKDNEPPVALYVSDDKAYLNTVRRNLGQAGFSVVTTRSPKDAVELTVESEFDAVLIDYDLLQIDALTLLEQIRNLIGDETPPTLVITEQETATLKTRCFAAGASGHHAKSESIELLIERVTSSLRSEIKRSRVVRSASRMRFKGGTDPLTQVATKEHFRRRLKGESAAAYRDQSHLSLLIISVDNFDKTVDRFGRQRADGTLAQGARLIEGELRSRDCVARYSEHTFAVVLPDTKIQAASAVGRRLRRRMASSEFGDLEQPISLTVSIGAGSRPPGMQMLPNDLVAQAERASEAALKMGGDRVLADNALTGCPLVLLVGDHSQETGAIASGLEDCNVEVRLASSFEEARGLLEGVPIAMVMTEGSISGSLDGIDLLEWLRDRFPAIRRVLVSDHVSQTLVTRAINRAAIHYFIPVPTDLGKLPSIVDELLFS
ncbi:MAG: diguanylate cyclase [Proteobacteria bacterium]|nr:diguanylate cyclase [Pseudomonadota bacterium]